MKIDVTQKITDIDGIAIDEGKATLRKACLEALLGTLKGDENMGGADKAKLFFLASKINEDDEPDLQTDEWALVKERVGRAYSPLVVGRVYAMIEASNVTPLPRGRKGAN